MHNRVLFVDDDPNLLAAMRRQLRRKVEIETVTGGREGLDVIRRSGPYPVVVTDYCMPEMDGIEFLTEVRKIAPETVRMLLTGSADLNAAIQAVNQGNIFRFLTKPCPPEMLLEAVQLGLREYRHSHKERKFNKRTRRLLAQARDIQQALMPEEASIEGLDIAGRSIYCDQTGGDYYDFFEKSTPEGRRVVVAVGDVSDHGLPSALLMTSARAFLRESASRRGSVSAIVGSVNRQLTRDVQTSGRFMTLFYAEIDPRARTVRWVRAGHEPALLYDPAGRRFEDMGGSGGLPLGVFEDALYDECSRPLSPGHVLAIGTDGIWEARNPEGLMFGKQGLQNLMRELRDRPAAEILESILEALRRFIAPLEVQDDATLVIVKLDA